MPLRIADVIRHQRTPAPPTTTPDTDIHVSMADLDEMGDYGVELTGGDDHEDTPPDALPDSCYRDHPIDYEEEGPPPDAEYGEWSCGLDEEDLEYGPGVTYAPMTRPHVTYTEVLPEAVNEALTHDEQDATLLNFWDLTYAKEYVESHPQVWVVDQLLEAGTANTLASEPKAGKSTLCRTLALCVARGTPFLGRACRQGTVLYYSFEDRVHKLTRFIERNAAWDAPIVVVPHFPPGDFYNANAMRHLAAGVRRFNPALILIDMASNFMPIEDYNDYQQVTAFFTHFQTFLKQHGTHTTILLTLHTRKGTSEPGMRTDPNRVLGTVGWQGRADTQLIYNRDHRTGVRYIGSRQREGTDIPESAVKMCPDTWLVDLDPDDPGEYKILSETERLHKLLCAIRDTPPFVHEDDPEETLDGYGLWANICKQCDLNPSEYGRVRRIAVAKGWLVEAKVNASAST